MPSCHCPLLEQLTDLWDTCTIQPIAVVHTIFDEASEELIIQPLAGLTWPIRRQEVTRNESFNQNGTHPRFVVDPELHETSDLP